jgi:DNA-binding XRE family transcriptional regulator
MARTLSEVIADLPRDQQQDIAARAAQLIEDEMTLRDLRKAHELTQERIAETLRISQDGVSRIEKRSDFCSPRCAPMSRQWAANSALSWNFRIGSQ